MPFDVNSRIIRPNHLKKISEQGIIKKDLYVYYDFSNYKSYPNSGTTLTDLSYSGSTGTLYNSPSFSATNRGYFTFDGVDDYILTNRAMSTLSALSNFSMSAWIKITSYPTAVSPPNGYGNSTRCGVLLGATYYAGAALYWYGNSAGNAFTMYGFIRGADAYRNTSGYSLGLNTWTYFTFVNNYSAGTIHLYANGSLHSTVGGPTQEYNSGLISSAGNICISLPQVDGGGELNYSYFPGQIGSVEVYRTALSASDVLYNFNATKTRFGVA